MSNAKSQQDTSFNFVEEDSSLLENQLEIYDQDALTNNFEDSLRYKKFIEEKEEVNQETNPEKPKKDFKLPKFLENSPFKKKPTRKNLDDIKSDSASETADLNNINSIGSVFSKDHEEVNGLRRVFKKSISFLVIHLTLFLALSFSGLFLFSLNPILTFGIAILYLVFTNIFFIIVADKSYVFLAILAQAILLIFSNAFFGLGFHPITLILTLIIITFNYLAYSELEKIQLSSRLFSISHITGESTRILLTSITLILALGAFNGISSEGSSKFIERIFLNNDFIMSNFILDGSRSTSLNRYLMNGRFAPDSAGDIQYFDRQIQSFRNATYRDFLKENYESSEVLTQAETDIIKASCITGINSKECNDTIKEKENVLLQEWDKKAYSTLQTKRGLKLEFNSELTTSDLETLTKQLYENEIGDFESVVSQDTEDIPAILLFILDLVPLTSVIPAFFAIGIFVLLSLSKFIFVWVSLFISLIAWNFFRWTGLVQIDIETVESEIVTI